MLTSRPPLIGIPCYHDLSGTYSNRAIYAQGEADLTAIVQAGGTPFLMPLNLPEAELRRLYDLAAGILLAGGGDVDPALYGYPPHPAQTDVQPDRDRIEISLCRWAAAEGKPLLAVCRGIQVAAVAGGGTLYQDVPSQLPEATCHHYTCQETLERGVSYLAHTVELEPGCRLAGVLQAGRLAVNSLHHQAVRTVPAPWRIVGWSEDGVIEAIELPEHPFYSGVQWHPELLTAEQEPARRLFREFVAACRLG